MSRFSVHRVTRATGLVVDCQSDLLDDLDTRVVVPLMQVSSITPASQLNPVFIINGEHFALQTPLIFAVPIDRLSPPVTSLADKGFEILSAIDMLWSGV